MLVSMRWLVWFSFCSVYSRAPTIVECCLVLELSKSRDAAFCLYLLTCCSSDRHQSVAFIKLLSFQMHSTNAL